MVCDLGTDTLAFYDKNLQTVSEAKAPNGYGIRHLVFSKNGTYIYSVNELLPSISVFIYKNGEAKLVDTIEIDCKNKEATGAAIRLSDNGKYLYCSLRGENVICVYSVHNEKLTLLQIWDCGGDSPRDFNIFHNHLVVCNEKSGNAALYELEKGLIKRQVLNISIKGLLCCL